MPCGAQYAMGVVHRMPCGAQYVMGVVHSMPWELDRPDKYSVQCLVYHGGYQSTFIQYNDIQDCTCLSSIIYTISLYIILKFCELYTIQSSSIILHFIKCSLFVYKTLYLYCRLYNLSVYNNFFFFSLKCSLYKQILTFYCSLYIQPCLWSSVYTTLSLYCRKRRGNGYGDKLKFFSFFFLLEI